MSPQIELSTAYITGPYRYHLERRWTAPLGNLGFIMLNPSTADGQVDDATIRKCIGFAGLLGFGGIEVANLFAYRATDPKAMKQAAAEGVDIVGPLNNSYILSVAQCCKKVVAAWGTHGAYQGRGQEVLTYLRSKGYQIYSLGELTKGGHPPHPLYLPYTTELKLIQA